MRRNLAWLIVLGACINSQPAKADPPSPFARWESAISAFEEQDKTSPPPQGAVLFVGSSSIRLWDLEKSFPDQATINRGFGGSEIADSVHFADRLILKHKPRTIVFYAGDNDIAKGKSAQQVAEDFRSFVKVIHKTLPKTKIVYIAIKPSLARWKLAESMKQANRLIEGQCQKEETLTFIDVWEPMLDDEGRPRAELFVKDGLHLSEKGYRLWASQIRPHLPSADQ